jgi:Tfp pilus assembly major pilin PilA
MKIKTGRFGRSTACGALAFGLVCGQLAVNQSSAAEPKSRSASPAPSFNPTDPILKCTAHGAKAASTYVVVQVPVEQMDDASLAWEKSYPDAPVCVKVSADDAVQFLSMARKNPTWVAAQWQPTADVLKAASAAEPAKPVDAREQAQAVTDQAEAAARGGDYTAALGLAKKAADLGRPLDASEVAYWTKRSAQQEQAAADAAKLKAAQQAAVATAEQIKERQQKDYKEFARRAALAKDDEPSAAQLAMQGVAMGQYAQSMGTAIAANTANGSHATQTDAVGSTNFARNERPLGMNRYRPATDCITLDKGQGGPATVASNKCDYKVVFLWCVEGAGDSKACARDGALPQDLNAIEAHGRVTIAEQTAGLKVRTWACEAPGVPTTTSGSAFECR